MSAFETLYWLNVANNLRVAAIVICFLTTIVYVIYAVSKKLAGVGNPSKKITIICAVVFSICLLLSILLPDRDNFWEYRYELGKQAAIELKNEKQ